MAELEVVFASRTLAAWREAFAPERFPWAPFQSVTEIASDPQVVANGYIGSVDDGDAHYSLPTGAVQFDERPAALRRAPGHGEQTDEVLLDLGYDWDRILELKLAEVVK
jgi:crotonobetainyl-CoA:carnitine CoA-transferase CaiB-like acyl-CoA transferase